MQSHLIASLTTTVGIRKAARKSEVHDLFLQPLYDTTAAAASFFLGTLGIGPSKGSVYKPEEHRHPAFHFP